MSENGNNNNKHKSDMAANDTFVPIVTSSQWSWHLSTTSSLELLPRALDKRVVLLTVVFVFLHQLLLLVRQVARPLRKELLHLFPVVFLAVPLLVPRQSVERHLQHVVVARHVFRALEVRLVVRLGGHVIPDDVIDDVSDEFLQLHGEGERGGDHVPRVLGVVVRRRLAAGQFVSGAHARHVLPLQRDEVRQLRQLIARGATEAIVPVTVSGVATEALGMADKCGQVCYVIAAVSATLRMEVSIDRRHV